MKESAFMSNLTPEEEERKRLIFEGMSPRRRKQIEKRGYDKWDPFLKPKEPPFVKGFEDKAGLPENPLELYHYYLTHGLKDQSPEDLSEEYLQGVVEACRTVKIHEERLRGYCDFYSWYSLEKAREEKDR
jgi:hypothetical protein